MKTRLLKFAIVIASVSIVSGCGGDSDSSSTDSTFTGTLIDSPVSGVSYSTDTLLDRLTNAEGQFEYKAGETVTFRIGNIVLGSNEAKSEITPLDLLNTNNVNSDAVVNMIRFLQTLDGDGDLSTINITSSTRSNASAAAFIDFDFNQTIASFEVDTQVTGLTQAPLVDTAAAIAHFENSLNDINYTNGIVGAWVLDGIASDEVVAFIFTDSGEFVHVQAGPSDPSGTNGMEFGTYSWDSGTGVFSATISTDTNDGWGFSGSDNLTLAVAGDSATFGFTDSEFPNGSSVTLTRIPGMASPLHGGWEVAPPNGGSVFLIVLPGDTPESGTVVLAESGEADEAGQSGIEISTYSWDESTGALNVSTPSVDTNGEWGLSHSITGINVTVFGDRATITEGGESFNADRVF